MVRQSFAAGRHAEHERLIAALLEACAFCEQSQNWTALSELLAQPKYVNAPAECIGRTSTQTSGPGPGLSIFHGHGANDPSEDKSAWLIRHLYEVLEQHSPEGLKYERAPVLLNIFQPDAFARAQRLVLGQSGHELVQRPERLPLAAFPIG